MSVEQSNIQPGVGQQAISESKAKRGSRRAAWVAWSLLGLGLALLGFVVALALINGELDGGAITYILTFNAFLFIGALIAARQPGNPIGWMFCAVGLTTNLALALMEYSNLTLSNDPGSFGGIIAGVLVMFIQPMPWFLIFISFMIFPTGRPVNLLLGVIMWVYITFFGLTIVLAALVPTTLGYFDNVSNPLHVDGLADVSHFALSSTGGLSIILIGVIAIVRYRRASPVERLQLKWVTYAALIPFIASLGQGALANLVGIPEESLDNLSLLPMLWLAISVAIAILRYRLYEIDILINNTLVYVPLTAILAGLYAACLSILQRGFQSQAEGRSDFAIVFTAFLLTTLFTPIKNALQAIVDSRWKEPPGSLKKLKAFGKQVRESFSPVDRSRIMQRLLTEGAVALHALSGATYLQREGQMQLVHTYGDWQEGGADLEVYLESGGEQVGLIKLGNRAGESEYTRSERKTLQDVADVVAGAISS